MSQPSGLVAVLFDYGGVLTTSVWDAFSSWLRADQIDPSAARRALRSWLRSDSGTQTPLHRLETGALSGADFSRELAGLLPRVDGGAVPHEGLLTRMFADLRVDEAMCDLVRDCRQAGLRTAMISNSWGNPYPQDLLADLFDVVVISGRVGLRKPDARIYRLALRELDVDAAASAFLDDFEENVDGARAVGMHALRHVDAESTRAWLRTLTPALDGATGERE